MDFKICLFGRTFCNPLTITLEGISYHSNLTSRHSLSQYNCSRKGRYLLKEEDCEYKKILFLPSFIPRHHASSQVLSLVFSFFHTLLSHSFSSTVSLCAFPIHQFGCILSVTNANRVISSLYYLSGILSLGEEQDAVLQEIVISHR